MIDELRMVLKRQHCPLDGMLVCVRRHAAYLLRLRDLEEVMAERGVAVDKAGHGVDLLFRAKRDHAAARTGFERAIDALAREPEARRALLNR